MANGALTRQLYRMLLRHASFLDSRQALKAVRRHIHPPRPLNTLPWPHVTTCQANGVLPGPCHWSRPPRAQVIPHPLPFSYQVLLGGIDRDFFYYDGNPTPTHLTMGKARTALTPSTRAAAVHMCASLCA